MSTFSENTKSGGVLIIAVFMLVIFTLVVSAALKLGEFSVLETEEKVRESQAFWMAEAGLQKALTKTPPEDVSSTTMLLPSGRSGTYEVDIDQSGNTYTIESLATVEGVEKTLQISATWVPNAPALKEINLYNAGNLELFGSGVINSDIYIWDSGSYINDGGVTINGTIAENTEDMQLSFNKNWFPDSGASSISDTSGRLDLNDGVRKLSGDLTATEIVGPGTLLVEGSYKPDGTFTIYDDVTVIMTGSFEAKDEKGQIGTNVLVYTSGSIQLGDLTMIEDISTAVNDGEELLSGGSTLVSVGNIEIYNGGNRDRDGDGTKGEKEDSDIVFKGVLHAGDGNLKFQEKKASLFLVGAVIGQNGNFQLIDKSAVYIDPLSSALLSWWSHNQTFFTMPTSGGLGGGSGQLDNLVWREYLD